MKNIMFTLDSVIQYLCMYVQYVHICLLQYDTQTRAIAEVHKKHAIFFCSVLFNHATQMIKYFNNGLSLLYTLEMIFRLSFKF